MLKFLMYKYKTKIAFLEIEFYDWQVIFKSVLYKNVHGVYCINKNTPHIEKIDEFKD